MIELEISEDLVARNSVISRKRKEEEKDPEQLDFVVTVPMQVGIIVRDAVNENHARWVANSIAKAEIPKALFVAEAVWDLELDVIAVPSTTRDERITSWRIVE